MCSPDLNYIERFGASSGDAVMRTEKVLAKNKPQEAIPTVCKTVTTEEILNLMSSMVL